MAPRPEPPVAGRERELWKLALKGWRSLHYRQGLSRSAALRHAAENLARSDRRLKPGEAAKIVEAAVAWMEHHHPDWFRRPRRSPNPSA